MLLLMETGPRTSLFQASRSSTREAKAVGTGGVLVVDIDNVGHGHTTKMMGFNTTIIMMRMRVRRRGRVFAAVGRVAVSRFFFSGAQCVGYVVLEEGGEGLSDGCGGRGGRLGDSSITIDGLVWV